MAPFPPPRADASPAAGLPVVQGESLAPFRQIQRSFTKPLWKVAAVLQHSTAQYAGGKPGVPEACPVPDIGSKVVVKRGHEMLPKILVEMP
eukprot:jgi/Tetstr1/437386/TSEL_026070.t1